MSSRGVETSRFTQRLSVLLEHAASIASWPEEIVT
jgi:hypothetical protein